MSEIPWSELTYDLQTAIEVAGLPCLVRAADDMGFLLSESHSASPCSQSPATGTAGIMKLTAEVSLYCVQARILQCPDSSVSSAEGNALHKVTGCRGQELLIPLNYGGQTQIYQQDVGKEYFNISEVVEDFPRVVRVEAECACPSPGCANYQVVPIGTVLELDRVTESTWTFRGIRHQYLICIDRQQNRELAFPIFSTVHFTKISDYTNYTLKDIVELLPLPQTVRFVGINPYDIATADDDLARDLLRMLSGTVQINGIRRTPCIVGLLRETRENPARIVVIPKKEDTLREITVYIPDSCTIDNCHSVADETIPGDINLDVIHSKLYLQYADQSNLLFLKDTITSHNYNTEEIVPPYLCSLTSSVYAPLTTEAEDSQPPRTRSLSSGHADRPRHRKESLARTERQARGVRGYLSHIVKRIKSGMSQVWLDKDNPTTDASRPPLSASHASVESDSSDNEGYVCYLDERLCDRKSDRYVDTPPPTDASSRLIGRSTHTPSHVTSGDSDMVYATVDLASKHCRSVPVSEPYRCQICKKNETDLLEHI